MSTKFSIRILFFLAFSEVLGLKVRLERGNVTYVNLNFLDWAYYKVQRFSRRSDYVIQAGFKIKRTWGNNVTIDIKFFEYLRGEFKPSYVGIRMMYCDFVNKEAWVGGIMRNAGITCPLTPGEYRLDNITLTNLNFPNVFPFNKGRVDIANVVTETSEPILKLYLVATFDQKQKLLKGKKREE